MSAEAVPEFARVGKRFGGLNVIDDLSFSVRRRSRRP